MPEPVAGPAAGGAGAPGVLLTPDGIGAQPNSASVEAALVVPFPGPASGATFGPAKDRPSGTPVAPSAIASAEMHVMDRALAVADAATAAIETASSAVRAAAAVVQSASTQAAKRIGAGNGLIRGLHPVGQAADPRSRFKRVAIVHYWLVTMRGGERVLERLLQMFPQADIFTHVYDPSAVSDIIRERVVKTSFIQKLPFARSKYQSYLPLMPMALEHLDLRGYDLVISSESGPAKGVIPVPDALHLCYVHSPMRYLWDHYHDYRDATGFVNRMVMPWMCHSLRKWDMSSAARVDRFLANSTFIRERIAKAWRRPADVVHPPVETDLFSVSPDIEDSWLWVGQLVPYKRADLAIDAFNRLGLPLTVVGDGPMAAQLRKRAGPTIRMIPRMSFAELRAAYARARALVFTAEEDFGIVPVEVMASGRPVLAYGRGGALDSVVAGRTGQFFAEQTVDAVVDAVQGMERWLPHFDPAASLARARDFAPEVFDRGILDALA